MANFADLPDNLIESYKQWRAALPEARATQFRDLAAQGQSPQALVISCVDSRVQPTDVFAAGPGDFLIHRNVANLVPPYAPGSDYHGTASAIEFAVKALKVPHILVLGHSQCGGVQACHQMCAEDVSAADAAFEFVGHWLDILRPAYQHIDHTAEAATQLVDMSQQGIVGSLTNLMGFPFVAEAVGEGRLSLHGAWFDIGPGQLHALDAASGRFQPVG